MPNEPLWLPKSAAILFNEQAVAETGENHALLDEAKLEGALMRPQNLFHYTFNYDTVSLATSYMLAIAQAHPFEQGNKRTGFTSGFAFMFTNGYELLPQADTELLAVVFLEAMDGTCEARFLEEMLKQSVVLASDEIPDL